MLYDLMYDDPVEEGKGRVHGNGFVQIELKDGRKVHVWWPQCPRQKVKTLAHNHNHGFESSILYGGLMNVEFGIAEFLTSIGSLHMYKAVPRKGKDTRLERQKGSCQMLPKRIWNLAEGSRYEFPPDEYLYHMTVPKGALVITGVERLTPARDYLPTVLCPKGKEPDNDFDRYAYPKAVWEACDRVLQA